MCVGEGLLCNFVQALRGLFCCQRIGSRNSGPSHSFLFVAKWGERSGGRGFTATERLGNSGNINIKLSITYHVPGTTLNIKLSITYHVPGTTLMTDSSMSDRIKQMRMVAMDVSLAFNRLDRGSLPPIRKGASRNGVNNLVKAC